MLLSRPRSPLIILKLAYLGEVLYNFNMNTFAGLTLFLNPKTCYLFRLVKTETNLNPQENYFAIEMAHLARIGDAKPLQLPMHVLQNRYEMLTVGESESLINYLKHNPNTRFLPVKYKNKIFDLGHETEAYRIGKAGDLFSEFEELIKQDNQVQSLKFGVLTKPGNPSNDLSALVLDSKILESLQMGLAKVKYADFLANHWQVTGVKKNILNFYGPPGTGKTLSAQVIAQQLGQSLFQVDYAQVESKYIGETGKNIQQVFQLAREHQAVLLLDEADSLVSQRGDSSSYQSNLVNETKNVFMQELDKFNGVVILTTNLFTNYDAALLRRVGQHINFKLPDVEQRSLLFAKHIPEIVPREVLNFQQLAKQSANFSGGDIKVVCEEAMVRAVVRSGGEVQQAKLTMADLEVEITKMLEAKNAHTGIRSPIGIN